MLFFFLRYLQLFTTVKCLMRGIVISIINLLVGIKGQEIELLSHYIELNHHWILKFLSSSGQ